MNSQQKNKPATKQFIYNLYNTYEKAYGDIPNAKRRAIQKVQNVTNLSRGTVYKILKEVRENDTSIPYCPGSGRKWATGISDETVEAIRTKILSLSASNNDHVSVRKIHAELAKAELFRGGKATLHTLLRQMGFFYRHCGDGWKLLLKKKTPINEQLNLNQNQFDNFSISNMMEVKHSPVAQMEFRSTTNGLPDEEEEDLDTLFDDGDGKSLTPPSDDGDTKPPILNGINKHPEVLTSAEILDSMDIDLIKDEKVDENEKALKTQNTDVKMEDEETEGSLEKTESQTFDVDLEEECSATSGENVQNPTDASKVRDTGDDLDTLLSKINDLVEDCMVTRVERSNDVVEIPDDDSDEIADISLCTEKKSETVADEIKDKIKSASPSEVKKEVATEEVTSASTDKMDIDDDCDDVVCLDSPLAEADKQDDADAIENALLDNSVSPILKKEKEMEKEEGDIPQTADKEPAKEKEVIEKPDEITSKPMSEAPSQIKEDEIFLIEDDDDDEPMKEAETPVTKEEGTPAKSSEKTEVSDELRMELEKELEKEIEKEFEEIIQPEEEAEEIQQIAKVSSDDKPPTKNDEDDDDDIVCLDDSMEEIEAKADKTKKEVNQKTDDEKKVNEDERKEPEKEKEEKVSEEASEEVGEAVTAKHGDKEILEKESLNKEPEKETADKVVEKVAEEVAEALVAKVDEKVVEKVLPEPVVEEVSKKLDVPDEAKSEAKETPVEEKKVPSESEKLSNNIDIVILDDDDDEDERTSPTTTDKTDEKSSTADTDKKSPPSPIEEEKKIGEKSSSSEESTTAKPSTILSDNSDNARDGVEEKEESVVEAKVVEEKGKTAALSESNSCSNSSNLLKETEKEREENGEQPPAKRIRLSQDEASSRHSTVSQEDTKSNTVDDDEVMEVLDKDNEDSKSLKRVHSNESVSSDFKKPKTDEDSAKVIEVEPEVVKPKAEVKTLPLYPPPKFDPPTIDLSLDFLRRFKKSVHKMTKSDLEELVLQKIVEAIVHKSEFSEMRDLIEKQEKVIVGHRSKITELNKQFRDLEMVHNRVLKDLETKNSQFIMPVKITRAVGLQVFFPNKKCDQPLQPLTQMQSSPAPVARSTTSLGSTPDRSSHTSSPANSSAAAKPVATSNNTTTPVTVVNNVQQASAVQQRRGCVQKLTPMRPDTPRNSPLNRSVSTQGAAVTSSTPSPVTVKDTGSTVKILNRTLVQKPAGRLSGNVVAASTPSPVAIQAVEKPKTMVALPGIATKRVVPRTDLKRVPKPGQSDTQTVAHPLPASSTVVQPQIPPSSTTNATVVTAKPVSKSVIDLTDEDDMVPTTPTNTNSPRTPAAAAATAPVPVTTPVARVAPSPSPNTSVNRGPYKVSVIPQQQLQQPKPNPPKQTPPRPTVPIAPKPNGVAVAVRQIPANISRYRHPAPLPNQPIHSSNPAWKLPPARPTIRISNLESGIVISWTIEDTAKEKYAESTSYQIYAYQETSGPPLVESWRHVGDVKAMLLPMAVTLTQFQEGQRYYFAVRAVDAHNRCGPFSFAKTWS